MSRLTPSRILRHVRWRIRRAQLRIVYAFSPTRFWNMRCRDIHDTWFNDDADYRIMSEMVHSTNSHSCLEIGCNGGRFSRFLVNDLDRLVCQDISNAALELCRHTIPDDKQAKVQFDYGHIQGLYHETPDQQFDIIISNRVLSALPSTRIAPVLDQLARIGKNLLINELLPGEPGATYYWFANDYDRLLANSGFICTREIVSHSTSFIQKFRLYQKSGE